MKHPLKAAYLLTIILSLVSLLLSGCADTPWPTWLTGEPDDAVLNAPRVVGRPPSAGVKTYPNLATVPEKPKDFSPRTDRQKAIGTMEEEKQEAQEARERLDALPGVEREPPPSQALPFSLEQKGSP